VPRTRYMARGGGCSAERIRVMSADGTEAARVAAAAAESGSSKAQTLTPAEPRSGSAVSESVASAESGPSAPQSAASAGSGSSALQSAAAAGSGSSARQSVAWAGSGSSALQSVASAESSSSALPSAASAGSGSSALQGAASFASSSSALPSPAAAESSSPALPSAATPEPASPTALLDTLLGTLRDSVVRDLAWLLLSADLLRPQPPAGVLASPFETPQELHATVDWLRALDVAPQALHRDLATTRMTRLGRYAEWLLGWFLQHGPAARLIAAGVPLRRAGVTLGECDFLLQTQQGARLHWELAVKCYLHAGDVSSQTPVRLADYVGPNLKDRFDLKLAHLLNHQLPLSAREEFAWVGHVGPWTPQMFIKGWLFYRHGAASVNALELDPGHGRGWWVTRSDWPAFAENHAQKWRVLPRLAWLAPRRAESDEPGGDAHAADEATGALCVDAQTLAGQTAHQHGPAMVVAFAEDDAGDLIERSRGFIVPDEWPEMARNYARQ